MDENRPAYEFKGGRRVLAFPTIRPFQQTRLNYVIEANLAPGYVMTTDLLARHGVDSDFASDTEGMLFQQGEAARAAGQAEGEARGRAEGEARGRALDVVAVLETRGLTVTDAQRQQILSCTDLDQLGRWLRRAVLAASADEVTAQP